MADTLVYLVNTYTKAMDDNSPEFLDDERFVAKLEQGYEQISTLPSKTVKVGSKSVKVTPMILRVKSKRNELSVTRGQEEDDDFDNDEAEQAPRRMMSVIAALNKSISTALAQHSDGSSHLGSPKDHNMPGMSVVSGELVGKAFDSGAIAGDMGQPVTACPFPSGSIPATKWTQGWHASKKPQVVSDQELARITQDAKELALSLKDDRDAVVQCPHRPGTSTHSAWVKGFKRGGGRVE